jgi:hypothetical protein
MALSPTMLTECVARWFVPEACPFASRSFASDWANRLRQPTGFPGRVRRNSSRKPIQRNSYLHLEATALSVVFDLASELTNDAAFGEDAAEPLSVGSDDNGTTSLLPLEQKAPGLHHPVDVDRAARSESAPYLTAFVAFSCSANARLVTAVAPTSTSGPLTLMRSPDVLSS